MISSGARRVGDLGVTAQVRVPDDRLDPVRDAARDAAAQHAPARIAAEIHLDQCPAIRVQRHAFDAERKHRNESSQRNEIASAEAVGVAVTQDE